MGDNIKIVGQEFQHLTKVRRCKVGDKITAFCGDGYDYTINIDLIGKDFAMCKLVKKIKNLSRLNTNITVYLASVKSDALDTALDNLTQLNIDNIKIFESEFTNIKYDRDKLEKIRTKLIQSCKQCERAVLPKVELVKFKQMKDELNQYDLAVFAYENANENFLSLDLKNYKNKSIALIVGGEGGFSCDEQEQLSAIAKRVSLGKTILRTPVAATALVSAVLANLGEWER